MSTNQLIAVILVVISMCGGIGAWALSTHSDHPHITAVHIRELAPIRKDIREIKQDIREIRKMVVQLLLK